MIQPKKPYTEKARQAWGEELPDWVEALAQECSQTTQNKAAKRVGISASQVSGILGRTYSGSLSNAEDRVRGVLMKATITCPVLGEIGPDHCLNWRSKTSKFSAQNGMDARMFRACRRCPRNGKDQT